MNKCINNDIVDFMRNLKLTCRYCKFSESACDDEDGYHCHCVEHNKNYLVMSGDYCSKWQEKDDD